MSFTGGPKRQQHHKTDLMPSLQNLGVPHGASPLPQPIRRLHVRAVFTGPPLDTKGDSRSRVQQRCDIDTPTTRSPPSIMSFAGGPKRQQQHKTDLVSFQDSGTPACHTELPPSLSQSGASTSAPFSRAHQSPILLLTVSNASFSAFIHLSIKTGFTPAPIYIHVLAYIPVRADRSYGLVINLFDKGAFHCLHRRPRTPGPLSVPDPSTNSLLALRAYADPASNAPFSAVIELFIKTAFTPAP
ncbi:hypothetical protein BJ912DRAFT_1150030 [Pholiota molesta]|nr:hypothetical protein BJ912DRAFT_1150030 [Pholiota molesta]